jgi:hypothetical protein
LQKRIDPAVIVNAPPITRLSRIPQASSDWNTGFEQMVCFVGRREADEDLEMSKSQKDLKTDANAMCLFSHRSGAADVTGDTRRLWKPTATTTRSISVDAITKW